MNLYVIRHGEAFSGEEDPERKLTASGKEKVIKLGHFLNVAGINIQHIFHSTKARAQQTAEIIAKNYANTKPSVLACLEPESDIKTLIYAIDKVENNTLLVGHLPNLELLSNFLLTGNFNTSTIAFSPSSIACFKREGSFWILTWLIEPDLLHSYSSS